MLKAMATACSMAAKNRIGIFMQIAAMVLGVVLTVVSGIAGEGGITILWAVLIMLLEAAGIAGTILLGRK